MVRSCGMYLAAVSQGLSTSPVRILKALSFRWSGMFISMYVCCPPLFCSRMAIPWCRFRPPGQLQGVRSMIGCSHPATRWRPPDVHTCSRRLISTHTHSTAEIQHTVSLQIAVLWRTADVHTLITKKLTILVSLIGEIRQRISQ
jgi:hypothetical protein